MARSRFRRAARSGARRRVDWVGVTIFGTPTAMPAAGVVYVAWVVPPSVGDRYTHPTVMRIRGQSSVLFANLTAVIVPELSVRGAQGLIVWPGEQATDDVPALGALQLPLSNPEAPWMWHAYVTAITKLNDVFANSQQYGYSDGGPGHGVDVKARRKLPENHGILYVAEFIPFITPTTNDNTMIVGPSFQARTLIAE